MARALNSSRLVDVCAGGTPQTSTRARGPGAAGDVETVVLPCGHSTYYEMPAVFSAMVARLAASV